MSYRAILFDVGGALDLEFAWESAVDGAIAAACGLEGIRVDQTMVEEASDAAVAAFAPDTYAHMIETLCGGDPQSIARVRGRMRAMVGNLDVFQLRPGIDGLLQRWRARGLVLGVVDPAHHGPRLERAGIAALFTREVDGLPASACLFVGDRLDADIAPARAKGMTTIQFRSGRWRRQRPRNAAETPDAVVTDVPELEAAIEALIANTSS